MENTLSYVGRFVRDRASKAYVGVAIGALNEQEQDVIDASTKAKLRDPGERREDTMRTDAVISLVSALAAGKRGKMQIDLCIPLMDGFFCACCRLEESPEAVMVSATEELAGVCGDDEQLENPNALCPHTKKLLERVVARLDMTWTRRLAEYLALLMGNMACPAVRRWFQHMFRRISAHVYAHCSGAEGAPDLKKP